MCPSFQTAHQFMTADRPPSIKEACVNSHVSKKLPSNLEGLRLTSLFLFLPKKLFPTRNLIIASNVYKTRREQWASSFGMALMWIYLILFLDDHLSHWSVKVVLDPFCHFSDIFQIDCSHPVNKIQCLLSNPFEIYAKPSPKLIHCHELASDTNTGLAHYGGPLDWASTGGLKISILHTL